MDIEPRQFDESEQMGGLWPLIAFLNNSCIPNVCIRRIGNAKVMIASRDMKAGTELYRTYTSALLPYSSRILGPFVCSCPRCHFERQLTQLEPQVEQLVKRYVKLCAPGELPGLCALELCNVAMELEKYIEILKLGDTETKWLRTAFAEAYAMAYSLCDRPPAGFPRVEDFIEAMFETAVGDPYVLRLVFLVAKKMKLDAHCLKLINEHFQAYVGHQTDNVIEAVKVRECQGFKNIWMS
ncbi:hypothetical protein L7F22_061625 [Adiantum nelumboides]|nr:hypothetical protein [Adiantum nelumboides]